MSREAPPREKSLVYHTGALGDFITSLPAFLAWRRLYTEAGITLLGRPEIAPLACSRAFNEVWDAASPRFAPLFSESPLEVDGKRAFGGFASALVFSPLSSPLAGHLKECGIADVRRQDPLPPAGCGVSAIDYHLSLFPGLSFTREQRIPHVPVTKSARRGAEEIFARDGIGAAPVVMHPGSGSKKKNWPAERFIELAFRLEGKGERVAWVLGPAEDGFPVPRGQAAWRCLPLPVVAALIARSRFLVGNDSGIGHLAAAVRCPCVVIFGPSDPVVWSPVGRNVQVIAGSMEEITVDDVWDACVKLLR